MNKSTIRPAGRGLGPALTPGFALAIAGAALWGLIEFMALCRSRWVVRR